MASDQPGKSSNQFVSRIQAKVEPETSLSIALQKIKAEHGLSGTTTRLTSFRLPRDLTLGGNTKIQKPKKVYIPNLNVQRTQKQKNAAENHSAKSTKGRDYGHSKGNTDKEKERSKNLIQSIGIWSTGTESTPRKCYNSASKDSDTSIEVCLEKPQLYLKQSIDKTREEEKLKLLLRDNFVDDKEPLNFDNSPITLPIAKEAKLHKEQVKIEIGKEEEENKEIDRKPLILENGTVIPPKKKSKIKIAKSDTESNNESIDNIVEDKLGSYVLIQFPDCLPGLVDSTKDSPNHSNTISNKKENKNESRTEFCTLNSLNSGYIGKLQILRSGKACLNLGESTFIVEIGAHPSFRQDLIAAKLDAENLKGDLINLGQVNNTLLCVPDFESMLVNL